MTSINPTVVQALIETTASHLGELDDVTPDEPAPSAEQPEASDDCPNAEQELP